MAFLPFEMIDEILCRVPVKPLLRFRCVSRGWCARIDSKDFAKKQLKTSLELNSGVGLLIKGEDDKFVLTNLDSLEDESPVLVEIDGPLKGLLSTAVIVGASNGLMCVHDSSGDYFVLNPITRKIRKLPRVPPEFPKFENDGSYLDGFGYDELNDDFKLVRIAQLVVPVISLFAMVYSLKNNAWTPIQDVPDDDIIFDRFSGGNMGVCGSGSLHWVFKELGFRRRKDVIVSFDLTVQQFKNVPYPPTNYPPTKNYWRFLDNLGEYLCIKDYHDDVVDLWVMNYPGAERTWYKALSKETYGYGEGFSVHSHRMREDPRVQLHKYRFLAFSRSGDDILVERQSRMHTLRLLFWDKLDNRNCIRMPSIRQIRQIRIPQFHVRLTSFVYIESLLQLTEDEDDPLQQKPSSIHKQKKNHEKNIRDDLLST